MVVVLVVAAVAAVAAARGDIGVGKIQQGQKQNRQTMEEVDF